jgi:hypothetical protein
MDVSQNSIETDPEYWWLDGWIPEKAEPSNKPDYDEYSIEAILWV